MGTFSISAGKFLLLSAISVGILLLPSSSYAAGNPDVSLFELSLGELLQLTVESATLTPAPRRYVPSAITVIDKDMIKRSGARSLDELFEIYVPNFQMIRHHFIGDHVGI